jgi:hypothetical protein
MKIGHSFSFANYISEDFKKNLNVEKWSDRKDKLQELIDIMEKHSVLQLGDQTCQWLIDYLSEILSKDPNINVASISAQALAKIASDAPKVFKRRALTVILNCFIRMRDTKPIIQSACDKCLDSAYSTTTFASILKPIKRGLSLTAPSSKIHTCEFFTRIMLKVDAITAKEEISGLKELVTQLCEMALIGDAACREAATRSLSAFMRALTKKVARPLLAPVAVDKLKMEKIEEQYEQFIAEYPLDDGLKNFTESNPSKRALPVPTRRISTVAQPVVKLPVKMPIRRSMATSQIASAPIRRDSAAVFSKTGIKPQISNGQLSKITENFGSIAIGLPMMKKVEKGAGDNKIQRRSSIKPPTVVTRPTSSNHPKLVQSSSFIERPALRRSTLLAPSIVVRPNSKVSK